jgi:hypothetical protein
VHRIGIELYTSLMTFKTFSTIQWQWSSIYDWLFATVMHVPRLVWRVCYSTVNIGKCKQQETELFLHMSMDWQVTVYYMARN